MVEALNYESDWPFDKENILPLVDMANHVAESVNDGDMEGRTVVRGNRKSQASDMTDIEECVSAAEFMRSVICK